MLSTLVRLLALLSANYTDCHLRGGASMEKLIPVLGLFAILFCAWLLSAHRTKFPWRIAALGLMMQVVLAIIILKVPSGRIVFEFIGNIFTSLLDCVDEGAKFVFGSNEIVTAVNSTTADDSVKTVETVRSPAFQVHYFAFKVLPTIIFFSSLMSVLYYLGVMQLVVGVIARVMQFTLKTSGLKHYQQPGTSSLAKPRHRY